MVVVVQASLVGIVKLAVPVAPMEAWVVSAWPMCCRLPCCRS